MEGLKELPREVQVTLVALILFIVFSFFDWQQVSVGPFTAGRNLWHGIGIITVLIAIAYLIWEIGRVLEYDVNLGQVTPEHDVGRLRRRAPGLHDHHVPRLERLPPLAGVARPAPLARDRGRRVHARPLRGRRAAKSFPGRPATADGAPAVQSAPADEAAAPPVVEPPASEPPASGAGA